MASERSEQITGGGPIEGGPSSEVQERISEALRHLRFGSVEIQVHEARVVRITRTEKVWVDPGKVRQRQGG